MISPLDCGLYQAINFREIYHSKHAMLTLIATPIRFLHVELKARQYGFEVVPAEIYPVGVI